MKPKGHLRELFVSNRTPLKKQKYLRTAPAESCPPPPSSQCSAGASAPPRCASRRYWRTSGSQAWSGDTFFRTWQVASNFRMLGPWIGEYLHNWVKTLHWKERYIFSDTSSRNQIMAWNILWLPANHHPNGHWEETCPLQLLSGPPVLNPENNVCV